MSALIIDHSRLGISLANIQSAVDSSAVAGAHRLDGTQRGWQLAKEAARRAVSAQKVLGTSRGSQSSAIALTSGATSPWDLPVLGQTTGTDADGVEVTIERGIYRYYHEADAQVPGSSTPGYHFQPIENVANIYQVRSYTLANAVRVTLRLNLLRGTFAGIVGSPGFLNLTRSAIAIYDSNLSAEVLPLAIPVSTLMLRTDVNATPDLRETETEAFDPWAQSQRAFVATAADVTGEEFIRNGYTYPPQQYLNARDGLTLYSSLIRQPYTAFVNDSAKEHCNYNAVPGSNMGPNCRMLPARAVLGVPTNDTVNPVNVNVIVNYLQNYGQGRPITTARIGDRFSPVMDLTGFEGDDVEQVVANLINTSSIRFSDPQGFDLKYNPSEGKLELNETVPLLRTELNPSGFNDLSTKTKQLYPTPSTFMDTSSNLPFFDYSDRRQQLRHGWIQGGLPLATASPGNTNPYRTAYRATSNGAFINTPTAATTSFDVRYEPRIPMAGIAQRTPTSADFADAMARGKTIDEYRWGLIYKNGYCSSDLISGDAQQARVRVGWAPIIVPGDGQSKYTDYGSVFGFKPQSARRPVAATKPTVMGFARVKLWDFNFKPLNQGPNPDRPKYSNQTLQLDISSFPKLQYWLNQVKRYVDEHSAWTRCLRYWDRRKAQLGLSDLAVEPLRDRCNQLRPTSTPPPPPTSAPEDQIPTYLKQCFGDLDGNSWDELSKLLEMPDVEGECKELIGEWRNFWQGCVSIPNFDLVIANETTNRIETTNWKGAPLSCVCADSVNEVNGYRSQAQFGRRTCGASRYRLTPWYTRCQKPREGNLDKYEAAYRVIRDRLAYFALSRCEDPTVNYGIGFLFKAHLSGDPNVIRDAERIYTCPKRLRCAPDTKPGEDPSGGSSWRAPGQWQPDPLDRANVYQPDSNRGCGGIQLRVDSDSRRLALTSASEQILMGRAPRSSIVQ